MRSSRGRGGGVCASNLQRLLQVLKSPGLASTPVAEDPFLIWLHSIRVFKNRMYHHMVLQQVCHDLGLG
jgi:hypothetical protein